MTAVIYRILWGLHGPVLVESWGMGRELIPTKSTLLWDTAWTNSLLTDISAIAYEMKRVCKIVCCYSVV
jgi:hypothetical protein